MSSAKDRNPIAKELKISPVHQDLGEPRERKDSVVNVTDNKDEVGDANSTSPTSPNEPFSPGAGVWNRGVTPADSTFQWGDSSQTLFIVDWDDTLFPTSALFDKGEGSWGLASKSSSWGSLELSQQQEAELEEYQSAVFLYVRTACALSDRCSIVTNSRSPWVDDCIDRFAPSLRPLFKREDGPHVVYALEIRGSSHLCEGDRGNPSLEEHFDPELRALADHESLTRAKYIAIKREAKRFYSQYPGQTWKNILSIGDSKQEYIAAQEVAFRRKGSERENLRMKTIITPHAPTVRDLTYRLRLATTWLAALVKFDGDLDVDFNTPDQLHVIADALGLPELRTLIRPMPLPPVDEEELVEELDEATVLVHNAIAE